MVSTYEILQILNFSLIDKIPLQQLFDGYYQQNLKEQNCNQLELSL